MVLQYQGNKKDATFKASFLIKINNNARSRNTFFQFSKGIKQISDAI